MRKFKRVWGASCYKGGTSVSTHFVPLVERLQNQEIWTRKARETNIEGIILTGWSRFSHISILCELFPASIVSLSLCLQVIQQGHPTMPPINQLIHDFALNSNIYYLYIGDAIFQYPEQLATQSWRRIKELGPINWNIYHESREQGNNLLAFTKAFELSWKLEKCRVLINNVSLQITNCFSLRYDTFLENSNLLAGDTNLGWLKEYFEKCQGAEGEGSEKLEAMELNSNRTTNMLSSQRQREWSEVKREENQIIGQNRMNQDVKIHNITILQHCLLVLKEVTSEVDQILTAFMFSSDILEYKNVINI